MTRRIESAREGRMARFATQLRHWLPLAAAMVVLLLFAWPALRPRFKMPDIANNAPNLVIDNVHYTGADDKNQTYSLSAAQATRALTNAHGLYDLTKPQGDIQLDNGAWIDGKADFGRYDERGKRLWLGGNVEIFHNDGYRFRTEEAQVNLENKAAWGTKGVRIQGSFGAIEGNNGFRLIDDGKTLVVNGPAKATFRTKPEN